MSSQEEQIEQRKANLDGLKALGVSAYPHKFERRHTISELVLHPSVYPGWHH